MPKSMTAFGRATGSAGGKNYTVEIKSVNNRYLDCSVRLPRAYGFLEEKILGFIKGRGITRGKLDVYVGIEVTGSEGATVELDSAYAEAYVKALRKLRDISGLTDDISVMTVAQNRDLFIVKKPEEDAERDWAELLPVLSEANTRNYREKLIARLKQTLDGLDIEFDGSRILTECAIFADRTAVDEELVRLKSHFDAFDAAMNSSEPVGRRLDFLLQEMNREVNTTGSKSNDAEIAALVVDAKCALEKIREQIQNLE